LWGVGKQLKIGNKRVGTKEEFDAGGFATNRTGRDLMGKKILRTADADVAVKRAPM